MIQETTTRAEPTANPAPQGTDRRFTVTGLVLAGGRSRRFGSDKSRFEVNGIELRVHAGRILRVVTDRVLLSVATTGSLADHEHPDVAQAAGATSYGRPDVPIVDEATNARKSPAIPGDSSPFDDAVADVFADRGPLAGIHAGLRSCGSEYLLVLPCDMPRVHPASLAAMARAAADGGNQAAVATSAGRVIGVVGCYRKDVLPLLEARLGDAASSSGVEEFVRTLARWTTVGITPTEAFNFNRPADA